MSNGDQSELDQVINKIIAGEEVPPDVLMIVFASALREARKDAKTALALATENKKLLYGITSIFAAAVYATEKGWLNLPF